MMFNNFCCSFGKSAINIFFYIRKYFKTPDSNMKDYAQEFFLNVQLKNGDVSRSLSCFHDLMLWAQRQSKRGEGGEMAFGERNEFSDMNHWYKRLLWRGLPWEAWILRL